MTNIATEFPKFRAWLASTGREIPEVVDELPEDYGVAWIGWLARANLAAAPIDIESERARFEVAFQDECDLSRDDLEGYFSCFTDCRFQGWLAAKRHAESTFRRDAESYWELEDFLGIGAGTDAQSAIRVIKEMIEAARNEGIKAHKRHAAKQSGTPLASVMEGKGEGE